MSQQVSPISPVRQFYRRQLPSDLVDFSTNEGKKIFAEALKRGNMNCYFFLAAQLITQDEPAYCGISTLVMVLNALAVDPGKVWKSAWRWYHESMLDCCVPLEVIKEKGITFGQFVCLANCNHLSTTVVRVDCDSSEAAFRQTIGQCCQRDDVVAVVSYSRAVLHQTGDGHFSTIGGYHSGSDRVLILDTARFKYPPHWVAVSVLFDAMKALDKETGLSRGYIVLKRRKDIKPLVLFKLSYSLTVFSTSYLDKSVVSFLGEWQERLLTPWLRDDVTGDVTTDGLQTIRIAADLLLQVLDRTPSPVTLFKTQLSCDCPERMFGCCQRLLRNAVADLKRNSSHAIVVAAIKAASETNPALRDKLSAFGEPDAFNDSPLCSDESDLRLEPIDFFLIFLLSWPYRRATGCTGEAVSLAVDERIGEFGDVIRNEIVCLRNQFGVLLEVWREGSASSCRRACPSHSAVVSP